jgi:hypothetical protein
MDNNPLKQYFRRPAVFITLPSKGKGYAPDVLSMPENGELPVYPMTAIDEITLRTPDALFNGNAVAEVIKSCLPNIKDPWRLTTSDLDAVLIGIRAAGGDNTLDVTTSCPSCKETNTYGVNLVNVLQTLKMGNYDQKLDVNNLSIKFKPMTYAEMNEAALGQFDIQRSFAEIEKIEDEKQKIAATQVAIKSITDITMQLIAKSIEYVETPNGAVDQKDYILDFLRNCDANMYETIRDYNTRLKASTELQPLDIQCAACSHQYKQPFTLNASDFFG